MRDLSAQVREAAERIHQEAEETHRLTVLARQEAERGRELSERVRREAHGVGHSEWQLDHPRKRDARR